MYQYSLPFSGLNSISFCRFTTFCWSIHQLMDIWDVSIFWLLWMMMLWISVYRFLCNYAFISLGYIPRGGIAGAYDDSVFNVLRKCLFSKCGCVIFLLKPQLDCLESFGKAFFPYTSLRKHLPKMTNIWQQILGLLWGFSFFLPWGWW